MNEWEQSALNKIIGKLGPDFHKCPKCGDGEQFQTWGSPFYLMRKIGSEPVTGAPAISVFVKACRECGYTELYCPDAIGTD